MRKNRIITLLALLGLVLPVLAAVTDFTADGDIVVSGVVLYESGSTDDLLILSGSTAESFSFNDSTTIFTVTNPDTDSYFRVGSSNSTVKSIYVKKSSGDNMACATNPSPGTSYVTVPTTAAEYAVYPSANTNFATTDCCSTVTHAATYVAFPTCGPATCDAGYFVQSGACVQISAGGVSGSSGGGGYTPPAPAMPTTTTGQVSATASAGGKTTLTTTSGTMAAAQLPANALSSNAVITLTEVAKTATTVSSAVAAVPATKIMVGSAIYNFTAAVGTTAVTTFNQNITLTFTYTDAQIAGLSESALKVYYWKEATSEWIALATTVNASTNTLTAVTNHFTNFAILADTAGAAQAQTIKEGAMIRAIGDIDVYIVKYVGSKQFKRLILSPSVFNSYGHLKWGDVMNVDKSVVDSFTTSELVRAVNDPKVYKLYPAGDTGQKRWVKTAEGFNRMGFDWDAIYEINAVDRNSYVTSANIE